jgi:hypothetical protein
LFSKNVNPKIEANEFTHISVTSLGDSNYRQANLTDLLNITPEGLELEKMQQPRLFVWWRRALAAAKDKVSRAKDVRKRTYAKLAGEVRLTAKALQEKNPTKEAIDDAIIQNEAYIKVNEAYREATKVYDDLEAVVESFRQRFEILKNLKFEDIKHLRKN